MDDHEKKLITIELQQQQNTETLARIETKIDLQNAKFERAIFGCADDPGMRMELDRLKQESKAREKTLGRMWTTIGALIVAVVSDIVHRIFGN